MACRRLGDWLHQPSGSGGVSAVQRCPHTIYGCLDGAGDVDEEERDHVGECPTATRQFSAWHCGNALGRLLVARPSLRASLPAEIEAGVWEDCWHVAGVLFETIPHSWDEYRQRAWQFCNASEYHWMVRKGSLASSRNAAIRLSRLIPRCCWPSATPSSCAGGTQRHRQPGRVRAM